MLTKIFKIFFFIFLLIYQKPLYSKKNDINDFNLDDLSNYFSAQISYDNQKNLEALKFFNLSKSLLDKHDPYLKQYIYSLILDEKIGLAIKELKSNRNNKNADFFEGYLLLTIDSIIKEDFKKTRKYLNEISRFKNQSNLNLFIFESLENFVYVFENKKIPLKTTKFSGLSLINKAFHSCYLQKKDSEKYFLNLFKTEDIDYSRYIFFYVSDLIKKNKIIEAKKFVNNINILSSNLLVIQTKNWIDEERFKRFKETFSCEKDSHLLSEFFFLIANLYSTQENFEMSNFYLNLSRFLNKKFIFNLTLLSENFLKNKNYVKTKKILKYFNREDEIYYWYRVKTNTKIISKQKGNEDSFDYINSELKKFKNPSVKILFDIGNIAKNFKKYKIAVLYYDDLLSKINSKSGSYAEILFRRGSSYERLKEYEKSDEDLLNSLKINPDDAYVLNYLAYSWLERNYKIDDAIKMLEKAHLLKKNDPFILDSVGWAYFLIGEPKKAEFFLKKALKIMPNDPVVNDHYGDVLWKLNRKIQAKYYWKSVLNLEKTEDDMKKKINIKLLKGLNKI